MCGLGTWALGAQGWQCSDSEGGPQNGSAWSPEEKARGCAQGKNTVSKPTELHGRGFLWPTWPFTSTCISSLLPDYTCIRHRPESRDKMAYQENRLRSQEMNTLQYQVNLVGPAHATSEWNSYGIRTLKFTCEGPPRPNLPMFTPWPYLPLGWPIVSRHFPIRNRGVQSPLGALSPTELYTALLWSFELAEGSCLCPVHLPLATHVSKPHRRISGAGATGRSSCPVSFLLLSWFFSGILP